MNQHKMRSGTGHYGYYCESVEILEGFLNNLLVRQNFLHRQLRYSLQHRFAAALPIGRLAFGTSSTTLTLTSSLSGAGRLQLCRR